MSKLQPVILSGGSGTRLWPLSRKLYPKQFMDMGGETLFGQTLARALALPDSAPPIVVCNEEHRFLAAAILQRQEEQGGRQGGGKAGILLEPVGRNTAPAMALGALAAREAFGDPLILALSSDHIISPQSAFADAVAIAAGCAQDGGIAVFGVPPSRPETGYGYIRQGKELGRGCYAVERFVEKPDAQNAGAMLADGGYLWNSGMFLFRASVFLEELALFAPDVHAACLAIWQGRSRDLDFTRFSPDAFAVCPSISVDYAVMEHTRKARVVPLRAGWNDMGSWESFYETSAKDAKGNVCAGDVLQLDSRDCYLHSSHRLVAAVGLEGVSVVETADAVLVLPRERNQEVKALTDELKRLGRPESDLHVKVYRPWGAYETLVLRDRFQVKRIIVKPGGILSLQLHHHRAEHWVVVRGTATVTVGESVMTLGEDQSTYIPIGSRHRLENKGDSPLEIIEIQTGSYLGEDDIVRFEDTYGRVEA